MEDLVDGVPENQYGLFEALADRPSHLERLVSPGLIFMFHRELRSAVNREMFSVSP